MDKISVIVPCYNEEESLPLYYGETSAVLASIDGTDHEFIFVDDGSSDNTLNIIKKLAASDPTVKYVAFSRNFGKEAAMYAGLKESDGDYCVIMDAGHAAKDVQCAENRKMPLLRRPEAGEGRGQQTEELPFKSIL